jgi:hypothetical protein
MDTVKVTIITLPNAAASNRLAAIVLGPDGPPIGFPPPADLDSARSVDAGARGAMCAEMPI